MKIELFLAGIIPIITESNVFWIKRMIIEIIYENLNFFDLKFYDKYNKSSFFNLNVY